MAAGSAPLFSARNEDIGTSLSKRRVALGLSLHEFSAASGYSASTISAIERGHRAPKFETVRRLEAILSAHSAAQTGLQARGPSFLSAAITSLRLPLAKSWADVLLVFLTALGVLLAIAGLA